MQTTSPSSVNISQFSIGDNRTKVIAALGSPVASYKEGQNFCDIYKTRDKGTAGKAIDFFTLGLNESSFTQEGATNSKRSILFCYSPNNKLISITQSDIDIND